MKISIEEARRLVLHAQGLRGAKDRVGKDAALQVIQQLGYVQIDTLAVVARAHHHTIWSRMQDYQESFLPQLVQEKKVFEYWSHAAAYLPMQDYRFSLVAKQKYASGKVHWFEQDLQLKKAVLERIAAEGPIQSKDFDTPRSGASNWYAWKPAKKALEQLFMEGKLMVAMRKGFQKVYDLTERVLPSGIDVTLPTEDEYLEHLIVKTVTAQGLVTLEEIGYLRGLEKKAVLRNIHRLIEMKSLIPVCVKGLENQYYALSHLTDVPETAEVHILSPFDNVVIQRKRLKELFTFDYMIESYVPEARRKFGYFCLPILQGSRFVGRLDSKADRKAKTFFIKALHLEKGVTLPEEFSQKLKDFAAFNGCDTICSNSR